MVALQSLLVYALLATPTVLLVGWLLGSVVLRFTRGKDPRDVRDGAVEDSDTVDRAAHTKSTGAEGGGL
jgi:hypothetical protein